MPLLLIIDPSSLDTQSIAAIANDCGYEIEHCESLDSAQKKLKKNPPAVVILNPDLPDGDGLDLLIDEHIDDATDIHILHREDNPQFIARCMRLGAEHFFRKPADEDELKLVLEKKSTELEDSTDNHCQLVNSEFGQLLGESRPMKKLYRMLNKVAATDVSVLLMGESGTGKERAASSIHLASERSHSPFVPVNCGAIPRELVESQLFGHVKGAFTGAHQSHKGYFQEANGGTLFLDELTEMDIDLQVKLLRALESGCIRPVGSDEEIAIDVRLIIATNRDPIEAIEQNLLREDLYYRISEFPISLPPLRNRGADVLLLANHFLAELCKEYDREVELAKEAADRLRIHDWPGNVRELKNAMTRAFILADSEIDEEDLPEIILEPNRPSGDLLRVRVGQSIAEAEKKLILATLEHYDNDKTRAAKELGISVKTLYNRMKDYEDEQSKIAS